MEEAAEEVTGNSLAYFPVLYPSLDCSTELWVHVVNWSPVITIWVSHRHNGSDLYKTRNLFLELRLFPCLLIRSLAPPVVSGLSLQNQNLVTRVLLLSFGPHPVLSSLGSTLSHSLSQLLHYFGTITVGQEYQSFLPLDSSSLYSSKQLVFLKHKSGPTNLSISLETL